jgi:hypothetical protein
MTSSKAARFAQVAAIAAGSLIVQYRANAVPTTPPAGYPYTSRQPMVAHNTITLSDPTLVAVGFTSAALSTDAAGTAVTIVSKPSVWPWSLFGTSINYYFRYPNAFSDGTPDTSYVSFDLRDQTGEFAGVAESSTWVVDNATWYYFYQEVNGEDHYAYFSTDSAGNIDQSTFQEARGRGRPDRCKMMSDSGVLQCPRNLNGIREIPTQVRSFLTEINWFGDAMSWTWSHLKSATSDVGRFLSDPTVQYVLAGIGIVAGVAVCCAPSFGTACAVCVIGGTALLAQAAGQLYTANNNVPTITNTSSQLRASGLIGCSGSACSVPIACGDPGVLPNGRTLQICGYPTTTGSCASSFSLLGTECTLFIFSS